MRLPFLERLPLWRVTVFASVLFFMELLQGTSLFFASCIFLFILIATLAFNLTGGLTQTSGAYIFFYAILTVILGVVWKAFLVEPADSNLKAPHVTALVFLAGISMMCVAAYISRKFRRKEGLLSNFITDSRMEDATLGCMLTGIAIPVLSVVLSRQNGSALGILFQLNRFLPLAIILGVTAEIRKSQGTRSVNIPVLISAGFLFFSAGIVGFSKEGMFTPILCWLAAACVQRYRVSRAQIIGACVALFLISFYLVPYSQAGREHIVEDATLPQQIGLSFSLLSDLDTLRLEYEQAQVYLADLPSLSSYFDKPQGLLDRLQFVSVDDALISYTEEGHTFGLIPVLDDMLNLVPHAFYPNKPNINWGNFYAHELGQLGEEDQTTGVSFSPTGEAFHLWRWNGIFFLLPPLWILLFCFFDSLCGDIRKTPIGLLITVLFAHVAPEQGVNGIIYALGNASISLIFVVLVSAYLMPLLGTLFSRRGIAHKDISASLHVPDGKAVLPSGSDSLSSNV